VEILAQAGPEGAVSAFVDAERYPDPFTEPDWLTLPGAEDERRRELSGLDAEERNRQLQKVRRQMREEIEQLKFWWLERMRTTKRPLQEKMALFWHGHFATSAEKVREPVYNYELNKVFREHGTGNFRNLVFEVGRTPAMLQYLDNRANRKSNPNENWARELMELFTMGIGSYSERDIREAARAFTGYTISRHRFVFQSNQHDYGEKTFLGRTGTFDGADIINIILKQPEVGRFIGRKIWEFFVYEDPDDELVVELGALLRELDYELKPFLRTIFLSKEFYSTKAAQGLIKSPAQYIVMLRDQLELEDPRRSLLLLAMRALGQDLFYPPNVKGWDGNKAWINTNTLLTRYNIPVFLAMGQRPRIGTDPRLDEMESGGSMMMTPAMKQQAVPTRQRTQQSRQARAMMKYEPIFEPYVGQPVSTAAIGLCNHFLGRPLSKEQTAVLTDVLALQTPTEPLSREAIRSNGPAFLQLVLSLAEYQLC
jgi:uncharacterized protein (DUF1800 family)